MFKCTVVAPKNILSNKNRYMKCDAMVVSQSKYHSLSVERNVTQLKQPNVLKGQKKPKPPQRKMLLQLLVKFQF